MAFNTPLKAWDRPLGDASWRRWFDILQNEGVDKLGGVSSLVPMGVATPDAENFGYSSREFKPELLSTAVGSQRSINAPPERESHDQFMARRPEIESAGLKGIRSVTGRKR